MAWGGKGSQGIADIVLRVEQNDPALQSLHIFAGRKFGPEEVQQLCSAVEGNTVLRELYASGHRLTPQTAGMLGAMLATNASLVSICVGDDALGDAGVKELLKTFPQNRTLQKLDLESKGISAQGASSIADAVFGHASLTQLILRHNNLTDAGIQALQPAIASLRILDLADCHMGPQGAKSLAEALKNQDCQVQMLQLDDNPLSGLGGAALAEGVWQNQSLQKLHLSNTGIADNGLSKLAQALPVSNQLTYLDLSSCSISNEGVSDLADQIADPFHSIHDKAMLNEEFHGAAPNPAHLQMLKLRDNQISDSGVAELGEALQQSSTLQDLDLAGNQVGLNGIQALAAASVLRKLCLFNCKLAAAEAEALQNCLQDHSFSNLEDLDLAGNMIEAVQMQGVLEAIQQQDLAPKMKVLSIGGNPAVHSDGFNDLVAKTRAARLGLDVAWQATDPGQAGG